MDRFSREDYGVAIICPMGIELAPVEALLDDIHDTLPSSRNQNTYTLGQIGVHFVVIAVMPEIGNNRAATVATQLLNDFPAIRFGLLVGIGGGIPAEEEYDIRLGDVVVSQPIGTLGGVVQYDLGKVTVGGSFERTGALRKPPDELLGAVQKLKSQQIRKGSQIPRYVSEILEKFPNMIDENYIYQGVEHDMLFKPSYEHKAGKTCRFCDSHEIIDRETRRNTNPRIHYGTIGSGNAVIKDSATRERLREDLGVCCVEMEAAGLMDEFPCLVIRGICDYADSHKNKRWQPYAAATAAAYMKELLSVIPTREVVGISRAAELLFKSRANNLSSGRKGKGLTDHDIACLQLLGPSNYREHKGRNPDRVEGTCQWFLQHPIYNEWNQNPEGCLLWTSADPGCGKSVLAKSLIDNELKSTEFRTTCYFFFKDDNQDQKSSAKAISALLHQLFSQKPNLLRYATFEYLKNGKDLPQLFSTLWEILLLAARDPDAGEIVCILDALDECEESGRYEIISSLSSLYNYEEFSQTNTGLKFLVTSRPYLDIERRFKRLTSKFPTIRLAGEEEIEAISDEIDLVIRARVTEMAELLDLDNDAKVELENGLLNVTHRTYLWLKLIFELIENRLDTTKSALRESLSTIPVTVEDAYEEILSKISKLNRPRARKLLQIVVAATRPLEIKEMRVALAMSESVKSSCDLDLESEAAARTTIRNLCGLFVSIIDSRIYLIHQTAREFLISKSDENYPQAVSTSWRYSLSLTEANLILAQNCIWYLYLDDFEPTNDINLENFHFLVYASSQWAVHFRQAKVMGGSKLFQLAIKLCAANTINRGIYRYNEAVREILSRLPSSVSSQNLVMASALGLESIVEHLMTTGISLPRTITQDTTTGAVTCSPLEAAVKAGHVSVTKILIEKGAPVQWTSLDNASLLITATRRGYEAIVRLLLENGMRVESMDAESRTPLHWAAMSNQDSIVEVLIQYGANVDAVDVYSDTPLRWSMIGYNENALIIMVRGDDRQLANSPSRQRVFNWAARSGYCDLMNVLLRNGINPTFSIDLQYTPLITSAAAGRLQTCQLLLDHNVDLNSQEYRGRTALIEAVDFGFEYIVKLLLEKGAAVDRADKRGATALITASAIGYDSTVVLLLKFGADVHIKDEDGRTALWYAARQGHIDVLNTLLNAGAKVDFKDINEMSPLAYAAERGHAEIVELLLDQGAQVNDINEYGRSPFWLASKNRALEVMEVLFERGAKIDSRDRHGTTPLMQAAANGFETVLRLLLDYKADVNCEDTTGRTAISYTAEKGHTSLTKLLLDNGADLSLRDDHGETPLTLAVKHGHMAIVELCLLSAGKINMDKESCTILLVWAATHGRDKALQTMMDDGLDVNTYDKKYGRTALCWAAKKGHIQCVRILLKHGANVNLSDSGGKTALWQAGFEGHLSIIDLLLEQSANIDMADKMGTTAMWQAAGRGYHTIALRLLAHGADIESKDPFGRTALWQAATEGHFDVVKLLIDRGANPDLEDDKCKTALWQAASGGFDDIVGLLLQQGVNIETRDSQLLRTPLHLAAAKGSKKVMKLLLDAGADIQAEDAKGQTPLSLAVYFGNLPAVEYLLERDAVLESRDKYGKTPFIWAIEKGNEEMIKVLLSLGSNPDSLDEDQHPALWHLIGSKQESLLQLLLAANANPNFAVKGHSPLSFAVATGNESLTRLLLQYKADVNFMPNEYTRAPLSLAAEEGHEEIVELLLDHGAEVDIMDLEHGRTPLWWAASRGEAKVVQLLLDANADKELEDNDGRTPTSIAKKKKYENVLRVLRGEATSSDWKAWKAEKRKKLDGKADSVGKLGQSQPSE